MPNWHYSEKLIIFFRDKQALDDWREQTKMMRQQKQRLAAIKGSTPGELTVHFTELGWLWLDKMTFILALDTNSQPEVPSPNSASGTVFEMAPAYPNDFSFLPLALGIWIHLPWGDWPWAKSLKSKISTWWMAIFGAVFSVQIVDPYNISCNYSGFVLQLRWRRLMEPKSLPRRRKRCGFLTFIEFISKLKATPFHSFKIKCFASTLWRWLIFIHTMRTNRCRGGSGGRGPGSPASRLFLEQTEAQRAEKIFWDLGPPSLISGSGWHPSPLIWRSGSVTAV